MLDAERTRTVAMDRTKPAERRRMGIAHRDDAGIRRQIAQQPLDVRARVDQPALACALRRGPARVQTISRCDGEQADVAPVLTHETDRLDRFGCNRAHVRNDDLTVGTRFAHPVGAVDDAVTHVGIDGTLDLVDGAGGKSEVYGPSGLIAQPVSLRGCALA